MMDFHGRGMVTLRLVRWTPHLAVWVRALTVQGLRHVLGQEKLL